MRGYKPGVAPAANPISRRVPSGWLASGLFASRSPGTPPCNATLHPLTRPRLRQFLRRTLQRTFHELDGHTAKRGLHQGWGWSLADQSAKNHRPKTPKTADIFEDVTYDTTLPPISNSMRCSRRGHPCHTPSPPSTANAATTAARMATDACAWPPVIQSATPSWTNSASYCPPPARSTPLPTTSDHALLPDI